MPNPQQPNSTHSTRLWHYAALLLLAAIPVVLLFNGSGAFYFGALDSDLVNTIYPWRVFVKRWFDRGVFPLWDPHVFGGYPVLETQQMLALNPVRLIATLAFNPRLSLLAEMAGYVLVAVLGTWVALRHLFRVRAMAALLGGICYVFGGLFSIRVGAGHFTVVAALCWWPLAIGMTYRLSRSTDRRAITMHPQKLTTRLLATNTTLLLFLSATNAMVLLAGGPQYVVYLFWMELLVLLAIARGRIFALLQNGTAWAIALALSAPQWLPTLWYLPFTGRADGSSYSGSVPADDLRVIGYEMLMPHPLGDDLVQPHLFLKAAWETSTYPGVIALVFSAAMLILLLMRLARRVINRRPTRAAAVLTFSEATAREIAAAVLILLGVYLMCGGWLPGFAGFREPIKARAILAFGIAFGAAFGFHRLSSIRLRTPPVLHVACAVALLVVGAVFWNLTRTPHWFQQMIQQQQAPFDPVANTLYRELLQNPAAGNATFHHAALWLCAISVVSIVALGLLGTRNRMTHAIATACVLLLSLADLLPCHWIAFQARHPYSTIELPPSIPNYVMPQIAATREAKQSPWRVTLPHQLVNRSHYYDGMFETGGYDPLMPARANNRNVLTPMPGQYRDASSLPLVHRVVARRVNCSEDFGGTSDLTSTCVCAIVNPTAAMIDLERNITPGLPASAESFGPRTDNLNYVARGTSTWEMDETPKLPDDTIRALASIKPIAPAIDGNGPVAGETLSVTSGAPHNMSVDAKLTAPALLVYRTTWLSGWRVRVNNGEWTEPLCANRWMLCVPLSEGAHYISFRYRPPALLPSIAISAAAWLLLLGAFAVRSTRGRTRRAY